MQVGATDATVGDLDVDVCLLPRLGLKGLPLHVSHGILVEAQPALELIVLCHYSEYLDSGTCAEVCGLC